MTDEIFWQMISANPGQDGPGLVYADWLEEQGSPQAGWYRRLEFHPPKRGGGFGVGVGVGGGFGVGFGGGGGFGVGVGVGGGFGVGFGVGVGVGVGFGVGVGVGVGFGVGFDGGVGVGFGFGVGFGGGFDGGVGVGFGTYFGNLAENLMEPGIAYLVQISDYDMVVGRCVKMTSPHVYLFESSSKVRTNNGNIWHLLCLERNKRQRETASYIHDTTPRLVPLTIGAQVWEGKTPQEAGYQSL